MICIVVYNCHGHASFVRVCCIMCFTVCVAVCAAVCVAVCVAVCDADRDASSTCLQRVSYVQS